MFIQCNGSIGIPRASAGQTNISFVARALFVVCESPFLFGENRAKLAHLLLFRTKSSKSSSTKLNGRFRPKTKRSHRASRSPRGPHAAAAPSPACSTASVRRPSRSLSGTCMPRNYCSENVRLTTSQAHTSMAAAWPVNMGRGARAPSSGAPARIRVATTDPSHTAWGVAWAARRRLLRQGGTRWSCPS